MQESRIAILGAGAFGTALAAVLARAGRPVTLIDRDPERAERVQQDRSSDFLPYVDLPPALTISADKGALAHAATLLVATPAQTSRAALSGAAGAIPPQATLVLCAKGLEKGSMALQTQIAGDVLPGRVAAVLTGPGFATEIAAGLPTALTLACTDRAAGAGLQSRLSTRTMRLYLTDDVIGAQIGGALKNVIAIACGAITGAGLGESARAALMTRGMAELTRIAVAMGARRETLAGLSGLGDLALTCQSPKSRNFALGQALGAGDAPPEALAEGAASAKAAKHLATRLRVDAPISAAVASIIDGTSSVSGAIDQLLSRPLRDEDDLSQADARDPER